MNLLNLSVGTVALVNSVTHGAHGKGLVTRLEAMGIIPNKPIQILRKAGLGGPLHIRVGTTTELVMRRQEAQHILIHI
ncbi:MAG: FeoA family protein [Prochlorotrichaceae cyanobacterium]|jgi:ferrous iron transport protein A